MIDDLKNIPIGERQEVRMAAWASGDAFEFDSAEAKAGYQYRAGLLKDAVQLVKTPDRVPVIPMVGHAPISLAGVTGKQAMNDPDVLGKAFLDYAVKYDPDAGGMPLAVGYAPGLEAIDYQLYKWPGHGVKDEHYYQFNEKEYMKADEYEHFINDLTDYWLRVWLPRTCGALAPLVDMKPIYGTMELSMGSFWFVSLGFPHIQEAFKALMEAGKQYYEWFVKVFPYVVQQVGAGYPLYLGGATKAPFDLLSDSFRGTVGSMLDLYTQPENVIKAQEIIAPLLVKHGAESAVANGTPFILMPLHKGDDRFMSKEQFEKFYWPGLKQVILGLIDQGCVPFLFAQGRYNERLEYLAELPKGAVVCIFESTDMARAREVLGGKICIGGGFPASMILTGTPEQVEQETEQLLSVVKGDGGYVLTIGCTMDDARPDTFKAFIRAGKKYGQYRNL